MICKMNGYLYVRAQCGMSAEASMTEGFIIQRSGKGVLKDGPFPFQNPQHPERLSIHVPKPSATRD